MLQLPDEINEEISADFSKSEIEDIKKEIDEENKISDIEVWMEGTQEDAEKYNEQFHFPMLFFLHLSGYLWLRMKQWVVSAGRAVIIAILLIFFQPFYLLLDIRAGQSSPLAYW